MIRAIALVDLDDTLFQTLGKCPRDVTRDALTPLGYDRAGDPLSFATPRQVRLIEWLSETALVLPVTARSLDALRRVRMRFAAAVCAHGGVILDEDGRPDAEWAARISASAGGHADELFHLTESIAGEALRRGVPVNVRVLTEDGTPLYVLAKHASGDGRSLVEIVDAAVPELPPGWTGHRNGNNVALLPPYLGKRHAVAHLLPGLRERHPDLPMLGIGDSLTDAPFMALCDYAVTPSGSQLARVMLGHD